MATIKLVAGSVSTILSAGLDSLANDAAATSSTITSTRDQFANLELAVTFASAPTADRTVDAYIVRTVDGTNFEDASASRPPASGFLGSFAVNNSASAQRLVLEGVTLDVKDFKIMLVNKSGQAFTSSGHTLKILPFSPSVE